VSSKYAISDASAVAIQANSEHGKREVLLVALRLQFQGYSHMLVGSLSLVRTPSLPAGIIPLPLPQRVKVSRLFMLRPKISPQHITLIVP
jgi:hypothetical protein